MCFGAEALWVPAVIGAAGKIGASALQKKQPTPLPPENQGDPNAGLAAIANNSGETGGDELMQRLAALSRARSFGGGFGL